MIHIFRKEIKKWHTVLWVVIASLALSTLSMVFFKTRSMNEVKVASVNGKAIYFDQYRRSLVELMERISSLRSLAQAYGMTEDVFLATFLGSLKPEELAIDACVKEILLDQVKDELKISIDEAWFKQELLKMLPQLVDQAGNINMQAYQQYLAKMSTTPAEFEKSRREELERSVVSACVLNSVYVPNFMAKDAYVREGFEKSFLLVRFPENHFVNMAKQASLEEKDVDAFYQERKESFTVPEKRKAKYWEFSTAEYAKKIEIDANMIQNFYERHKATLFRLPPKIKVRHILFAHKDYSQAKEVLKKAEKNPDSFAALAKEHSIDKKTAAQGGVLDFFTRGTHDSEFERAAFRLQKTNEVSKLIKTKQGYEIIQLVERAKSEDKPLDSVRDEIIKSIRTKRSLVVIRSDMEQLARSVRENPANLDAFVKKNNLQGHTTELLTVEDTKGTDVVGTLARRLFSKDKRQNAMGSFPFEDRYVIYMVDQVEKSYVPTLAQVRDQVMADYYKDRADTLAKNTLKDLRAAILDKKMTLKEAADKHKAEVFTTTKVKKAGNIPEFDKAPGVKEKLFGLTDQAQVLQFKHKEDYYLGQLADQTPVEGMDFEGAAPKIINQEKYNFGTMHVGAFIASLNRNAKIEVDKKAIQSQPVDMKD